MQVVQAFGSNQNGLSKCLQFGGNYACSKQDLSSFSAAIACFNHHEIMDLTHCNHDFGNTMLYVLAHNIPHP